MTGWWQHNEQRDFPFLDRWGYDHVREQVMVGGDPLPRDFLVDAFFVFPVTSASSGGSGVDEGDRPETLSLVNLRPQSLMLNSITRNGGNDGVVVIVSPHFDFDDRVSAQDPRVWYRFEIQDTAQRWDRVPGTFFMASEGEGEEPMDYAGYGVLVLGRSPVGVPTGSAYSPRSFDKEPMPAFFEADCVVYAPVLLWSGVGLANKVPSRYVLPGGVTDLDGSTEPVATELRAVQVAMRAPTYPAIVNGYGTTVDVSSEKAVGLLGREGGGLGHACNGIPRLPDEEFVPVSCAGLVKVVGGVAPSGGDLRIEGGPGLATQSSPGLVTLVLDGEEVVGGSV